jgi:O-antigen/teichoic acid export membrane protein
MAAVAIVIGIAQAFGDMGLSSALIARQTSSRQTLSSLYWLNIVTGIGVTIVVIACTPLVANFFHQPRLKDLLPWAALIFLIRPIGQQFQVLFERELRFDLLARVEVASAAVGMSVAVTAAALGAGAFSLVWGALTQAAVAAACLASFGWTIWRPQRRLVGRDLRGYVGFGMYQMGERTVNYLSANVDYLLIGRFLGVEALGVYSIAYQVVVKPLLQFNPIVTRVAFPAFAKRQDDDGAIQRGYVEMIRLIAFVVVPLLTAIAITAPFFVPAVFGAQWHRTIVLIQILAILGIFKALANPVGSVLLAKNRPDVGFKFNLALFVLMASALLIAVQSGLKAVAVTEACVAAVSFTAWLVILRRTIGLSIRAFWEALKIPVLYTLIMSAMMISVALSLDLAVQKDTPVLVAALAVGFLTYGMLCAIFSRPYLSELSALFRDRETPSRADIRSSGPLPYGAGATKQPH